MGDISEDPSYNIFENVDLNNNNNNTSNTFCKKSLIDYETTVDMLGLASLVYSFNIDIKLNTSSNNSYDLNNLSVDKLKVGKQKEKILKSILTKSPNCELYKFYDLASGSQVGVTISHKQKRICFVFRGSNQLIDWVHDFLICKREVECGGSVHLGFYKSLFACDLYNNLKNDYLKLADEYPEYNIYVTGHSLGAGLATLFSYFIADLLDKNITLITFASPRVGNKEWANNFEAKKNLRHYRFVNKKDIVTAIPYFYFYHVGNCIEIHKANINYSLYDTFKDIKTVFNYFNPFDHIIENYYINLIHCKWNKENIHCKYEKIITSTNIDVTINNDSIHNTNELKESLELV